MKDTIVFDIETKKSFAEVGGDRNLKELGVSMVCAYSYTKQTYGAYEETELAQFAELLAKADHLIGFNIKQFDMPVLEPYLGPDFWNRFAVTDMFEDVVNFTGHRVGLNALAKATLGIGKSGHGLDALQWYKEGKIQELKKYCLDDVEITKVLYEYGKKNGHVLFESYTDGKIHSVPVNWAGGPVKPVRMILEEALDRRARLQMEYLSSQDNDGEGFKKTRLVDVYRIKNGEVEAYCHLRQAVRNFRIDRILKVSPTSETYTLPQDSQNQLF